MYQTNFYISPYTSLSFFLFFIFSFNNWHWMVLRLSKKNSNHIFWASSVNDLYSLQEKKKKRHSSVSKQNLSIWCISFICCLFHVKESSLGIVTEVITIIMVVVVDGWEISDNFSFCPKTLILWKQNMTKIWLRKTCWQNVYKFQKFFASSGTWGLPYTQDMSFCHSTKGVMMTVPKTVSTQNVNTNLLIGFPGYSASAA